MSRRDQRRYERERKRDYRERNKDRLHNERIAKAERERIRELPDDARCRCCGETRPVFLKTGERCWNCAHAEEVWGVCPHSGIGTTLR